MDIYSLFLPKGALQAEFVCMCTRVCVPVRACTCSSVNDFVCESVSEDSLLMNSCTMFRLSEAKCSRYTIPVKHLLCVYASDCQLVWHRCWQALRTKSLHQVFLFIMLKDEGQVTKDGT